MSDCKEACLLVRAAASVAMAADAAADAAKLEAAARDCILGAWEFTWGLGC